MTARLAQANARRYQAALTAARHAIDQLRREGRPVNYAAVAHAAGVSRHGSTAKTRSATSPVTSARILSGTYADTWMHDHVLKLRTDELYHGLLKNHLKPTFGRMDLGKIREADIRRWRKERINAGP